MKFVVSCWPLCVFLSSLASLSRLLLLINERTGGYLLPKHQKATAKGQVPDAQALFALVVHPMSALTYNYSICLVSRVYCWANLY